MTKPRKPTRAECIAYLQEAAGNGVIFEAVAEQAIAFLRFDEGRERVTRPKQLVCPSCCWHFSAEEGK